MNSLKVFILIVCCALVSGGGCNLYNEMSDKSTDEAKIDDARLAIDAGDWTAAILKLQGLSAGAQAKRENVTLLASAYSGRCGLDVLHLVNTLASGTGTFMEKLMAEFKGKALTNFNDCIQSETLLKTIGNETVRNSEENILMALNSMAKMGALLAATADTNADGLVDAGFNNCTTGFTSAQAKQGVTAIALMITSLAAAGASMSGDPSAAITAVCNVIAGVQPSYNFCAIVDVNNVLAAHEKGFRTLVGMYPPPASKIGINIPGAPQATIPADVCP